MQQVPSKSLVRDAYERGQSSAHYGFLRASPFYYERVLIGGRRIDITPLLDAFFYAGFDGEPYPDKPAEVNSDAIQKQSPTEISRSASGQSRRAREVEGVGAGDGLQEPSREEKGPDGTGSITH